MRAYEEVRAAYMRVFDFDGTIYDGESLFDLYLFSVKYNPKVLRYIAPVLRYAIKYKPKRFRELYGDNARVDEFYTDSRFDQPMIDMARHAYMVKGNKIHQVK